MKVRSTPRVVFEVLTMAWIGSAQAVSLPSDWQHEQQFAVTAPGLVKLNLPVETLNAARPALEDLRLLDDAGNELPYWIEQPIPATRTVQNVKSFQVTLTPTSTIITLETGAAQWAGGPDNRPGAPFADAAPAQAVDGVTLETPADNFVKSVRVEASAEGKSWKVIAEGQPIFQQPNAASKLWLAFPGGEWQWLRLVIDDQRSLPIPFIGARVHAAAGTSAPNEPLPLSIVERHENPGETRLTLKLGSANLTLAGIRLETLEPLFTRQVTIAVPRISEASIQEQTLAQGAIYRIALAGQPASSNLTIALDTRIPAAELLLLIRNQDSPPLPIAAAVADRRPVYLVFLARQSGVHHLLTGNERCAEPHYDLARMAGQLRTGAVSPIQLSPLKPNPDYRPPEALPGIEAQGAPLDVSPWMFRKSVKLSRSGAQQLELDIEVLAHAQSDLDDLRFMLGGKQLPYVVERTSIARELVPVVASTNDAKDPTLSRWLLKLPESRLPLTRLSCVSPTKLFQREVTLYEQLKDERGETYRRTLAAGTWMQAPDRPARGFVLSLDSSPETDTLILETRNGDNPPIALDGFRLFYPATRVLFKAGAGEEVFLYYGNPRADSPRYDLRLVAGQLLASEKATAGAGAREQLKKSSWSELQPGKGGVLFWGILALVVVVLLALISRLLPKSPPPVS